MGLQQFLLDTVSSRTPTSSVYSPRHSASAPCGQTRRDDARKRRLRREACQLFSSDFHARACTHTSAVSDQSEHVSVATTLRRGRYREGGFVVAFRGRHRCSSAKRVHRRTLSVPPMLSPSVFRTREGLAPPVVVRPPSSFASFFHTRRFFVFYFEKFAGHGRTESGLVLL